MTRTTLLGSFLLAAAASACGDSADDGGRPSSATGSGSGGSDGGGGETAAPSSTASQSTGTAQGGAASTSTAGGGGAGGEATTSVGGGDSGGGDVGGGDAGGGGGGGQGTGGAPPTCDGGTPEECAAEWEQNAAVRFDEVVSGSPDGLAPYFAAIPKGADLHNHLTGSVYAETYLAWALDDGDFCINTTTFASSSAGSCPGGTLPVPGPGDFYDDIVRAWSMKDFVPGGAESGRDHFFATFGKFGAIAGAHRNENIADIATRGASENLLHIETMFNLGRNVGELSTDIWAGTLTEADLAGLYDDIVNHPTFQAELANDVAVVTSARSAYRAVLGCSGANPPAACDVGVRFIAQVSRTGAKDLVFGQLISAFEMAAQTPWIVGANLSSPEDETISINNYDLHMKMLDFLHERYTVTGESPLRITLHAGELTDAVLPPGSNADTFHIRQAVEEGHAERIGHGIDVLSETDSQGLLDDMRDLRVLVEVCLSSNDQILEVSGSNHPLAVYMENDVPVALATDDQGVSRSSLAGEYIRAALDQDLDYRQLKRMARNSLEHMFLPGGSLWLSLDDVEATAACAPTATMGLGGTPSAGCQAFLDGSERATVQWQLESRFAQFESQQ